MPLNVLPNPHHNLNHRLTNRCRRTCLLCILDVLSSVAINVILRILCYLLIIFSIFISKWIHVVVCVICKFHVVIIVYNLYRFVLCTSSSRYSLSSAKISSISPAIFLLLRLDCVNLHMFHQ